jgi:hypothetical protein
MESEATMEGFLQRNSIGVGIVSGLERADSVLIDRNIPTHMVMRDPDWHGGERKHPEDGHDSSRLE